MKAVILPLCIALAALLSVVVLSGCGETAKTESGGPNVIVLRDWPDRQITGGDGEVANRQHLPVDEKVIDVWTTWSTGIGASQVTILIGLRDHAWDEVKNW